MVPIAIEAEEDKRETLQKTIGPKLTALKERYLITGARMKVHIPAGYQFDP